LFRPPHQSLPALPRHRLHSWPG